MKVEIKLSKDIKEPHAIIFSDVLSDEIKNAVEVLENQSNSLISLKNGDKISVKSIRDLYMIHMEEGQVIVYDNDKKYTSNKRLYELEKILGKDFFRISKSTIINIKKIDSVNPLFRGIMNVKLKND